MATECRGLNVEEYLPSAPSFLHKTQLAMQPDRCLVGVHAGGIALPFRPDARFLGKCVSQCYNRLTQPKLSGLDLCSSLLPAGPNVLIPTRTCVR